MQRPDRVQELQEYVASGRYKLDKRERLHQDTVSGPQRQQLHSVRQLHHFPEC